MEITALTPDSPLVPALHRLYVRCAEDAPPHGPVPSLREVAGRLYRTNQVPGDLLAGTDGGDLVGAVRVRRPAAENTYVGYVDVVVDPAWRRRGLGRELLAAGLERVGGRRLVTDDVVAGGAGGAFAARYGARALREDLWQRLDLGTPPPVPAPPPGYTLRSWTGRCPAELLDSYARCKAAISDAPLGDLDAEWPAWTGERVRADEATHAARGKQVRNVVALAAEGQVAGLTEILWEPGFPLAQQSDTVVRPEHRGHGLGLALKTAMLTGLPPELTAIDTWNTATNDPMLRVNAALGFRVVARQHSVQAPTADVRDRLAAG